MDLTEEQKEQYEQQLEDLSEKEILLEIMTELKAIRYYTEMDTEVRRPNAKVSEPEETKYKCKICGQETKESDRAEHYEKTHNGIPSPELVANEFEEL